ncbi:MAG: pyroglutamyl-peptidase I [Pseudolabrys sp.]
MPTILVTGFGPFPGAPFNPTGPLVRRLARTRHPAAARLKIVNQVFQTGSDAVDRDLPALVKRHRPRALLMFGLSGRARTLRIETQARNSLGRNPDVSGKIPKARAIAPRGLARLAMKTPAATLLAAARTAQVPALISRDAGNYLCNYLCWRATEMTQNLNGPRYAVFVHVPELKPQNRTGNPASRRRVIDEKALTSAARAMLLALAALVK